MKVIYQLVGVFIWISLNCHAEEVYVLYSSPGLSNMNSGIYGGRVDPSKSGSETNMIEVGYNSSSRGPWNQEGGQYEGSYDPVTKQLLVRNVDKDHLLNLWKGPLCVGKARMFDDDARVARQANIGKTNEPSVNPDPFLGNGCGIKSVAMYNSQIYFVSFITYGLPASNNLQYKVELRSFEGCEQYKDTIKTDSYAEFDLIGCSSLIATIASLSQSEDLQFGSELDIVDVSGNLYFFTVIRDYAESVTFKVYMINEEGDTVVLNERSQPSFPKVILSNMGGVDYKNGVFCWSDTLQLYCGKLDIENKALTEVVTIVEEGEPLSLKICKGETQNANDLIDVTIEWGKFITGVTIAEASPSDMSVYFGCHAGIQGKGGAGLVNVKSDGSDREIFTVRNDAVNGDVEAGSMLSIEDDIPDCPVEENEDDKNENTSEENEDDKNENEDDKNGSTSRGEKLFPRLWLYSATFLLIVMTFV